VDLGIILAGIATMLLGVAFGKIKTTTLLAPWCWLLATIWSIAVSHAMMPASDAAGDQHWIDALQFSAHAMVFCPFMSLLGARRPQNKMWEFIVFSLWLVLILPALETVLLNPGQLADTQGLRAWFMLILIAVSALNVILSRFWISGIFIGVSQYLLVNPNLPHWARLDYSHTVELGLGFAIASFLIVFILPKPDRAHLREEDRVWLDYRDMFGGMWALRIKERINSSATMYRWDLRLTWDGFVTADGSALPDELPEKTQKVLHNHFYSLMRKFVPRVWIDKRLGRETARQLDN
tara:strand:+ start:8324 stop:9205 length:882 start_codon:yes stop_codon:yes gene_type:complete